MKPWLKFTVAVALIAAVVFVAPVAWRLKAIYFSPWAHTATLTGVDLSPGMVTLVPGQAVQYAVTGKFSDGSLEPLATAFSATGGTVGSGGLYTAGSTTGTYRVIASTGSLADTSAVTITPLSTAPDAVRLVNQSPASGPASVLMDGPRQSGCDVDNVFIGAGTIDVGSLLAPTTTCPAEVAVFSSGNAMKLDMPVNTWTNNGGDLRTETLTPPVRVALVIWVDTLVTGNTTPQQELKNANAIFYDQKVGVDFDTSGSVVKDRSSDPNAKTTIGHGCGNALQVRASAYYQEGAINVYYVSDLSSSNDAIGWNCVDGDAPDLIYVSMNRRTSSTLAHELGHALGLQIPFSGHVDPIIGMTPENLMWSYGTARDLITLGQAYRMSAEGRSWLNLPPSLRPGQPVKDCGCNPLHSDVCPLLARNGAGAVTTGLTGSPPPAIACSMVICKVNVSTQQPNCNGTDVTILPAGSVVTLSLNESRFFQNSSFDTLGAFAPGLYAIWSSSNPGVAFARFDGLVKGMSVGCATINAWMDGVRASVKVKVGGGAC